MTLSWTTTQDPTRHLVRIPLSWYFLSQQHGEKAPASPPLPRKCVLLRASVSPLVKWDSV